MDFFVIILIFVVLGLVGIVLKYVGKDKNN